MATAARTRYAVQRPRNDAYVGLLTISLLALVTSCILLYLDYAQYDKTKPDNVPKLPRTQGGVNLPEGGGAPAPMGETAAEPKAPAPMAPMSPAPMNPGAGGAAIGPMGGAPAGPGPMGPGNVPPLAPGGNTPPALPSPPKIPK